MWDLIVSSRVFQNLTWLSLKSFGFIFDGRRYDKNPSRLAGRCSAKSHTWSRRSSQHRSAGTGDGRAAVIRDSIPISRFSQGWGLGRVPPRLGQDASRWTEETSVIPSLVGTGLSQAECPDPKRLGQPCQLANRRGRRSDRRRMIRGGQEIARSARLSRRTPPKRPLLRFPPLPRCFPNPRRQGGEAKNGPEGPL